MTISKVVKKIIEEQPFLLEALNRGIIHHGNLASEMKSEVESSLDKKVNESAIIMALRRYTDEVKDKIDIKSSVKLDCEITMKTNICDFNIIKSNQLLSRLKLFYEMVDLTRGDFLNITIGNHEISISISQKHQKKVEELIENEQVLNKQDDLVALTIIFQGDFFHTPGITYQVMQALAWRNINLLEIISTLSELTVVIAKSNAINGYKALHELVEKF